MKNYLTTLFCKEQNLKSFTGKNRTFLILKPNKLKLTIGNCKKKKRAIPMTKHMA